MIPPGCEVLLEGHSRLFLHKHGDLRRNRFLQDAAFVFLWTSERRESNAQPTAGAADRWSIHLVCRSTPILQKKRCPFGSMSRSPPLLLLYYLLLCIRCISGTQNRHRHAPNTCLWWPTLSWAANPNRHGDSWSKQRWWCVLVFTAVELRASSRIFQPPKTRMKHVYMKNKNKTRETPPESLWLVYSAVDRRFQRALCT